MITERGLCNGGLEFDVILVTLVTDFLTFELSNPSNLSNLKFKGLKYIKTGSRWMLMSSASSDAINFLLLAV